MAWLLGGWLLLVALGYLVAPSLVRSILTEQLSQTLQRQVSIERVAINPLTLTIEVNGFSVRTPAGNEQLGFEALRLNLSSLSLAHAGLVVDDIVLQTPRVSVTRLAEGRYDISDWLDRWLSTERPNNTALPRFSLNNIQIVDGHFSLDDRPKGVRHTAESVQFSLPFLSSLPYQAELFVEPAFSAVVDGSHLTLRGRSQPFAPAHTSTLDIDLQDLDLAPLQPYLPASLPVRLNAGKFSSRLSIGFAQPSGAAPSLDISGTAQVAGLAMTGASGEPRLQLAALQLMLNKADPLQPSLAIEQLTLEGLQITQDQPKAPLRIERLLLQQAQVDPSSRRLQVEQLQGTGIQVQMVRSTQGEVNWLALPPAGAGTGKTDMAPAATQAGPDWTGRIGQLQLDEVALRFEDRTLSPAAVQEIEHAQLKAEQLELAPGHANAFAVTAIVNGSGKLQASGSLQWQPLVARLALETTALPLAPIQGYIEPYLNTSIVQGHFSSKGQMILQEQAGKLQASYKGALTLGQFRAVDKENNTDLLKWKSLYFGAMNLQSEPARVNIGEIALSDFDARLILSREGRLNLLDVVRIEAGQASADRTPAMAAQAPALPIAIAKVTLQNGRVDFSDRFVQPNYSATVGKLGGSILNLSSAPETVAELDLRGSYAGSAPVQISAKLNPLADKKFLDLQANVSSVDLVDFSPYSGKYAGYRIDKGKLSLSASYKLKDRQLTADNRVFIDQLTFGEKVESPDATQLPVQLAIALLKNNRGEIDINLPISGSLDDPQFSIGGLIFKVIANLFVKAVTAPFALLGSLFGDSQELSQIGFAPGLFSLDDVALRKLQSLSKAMREREGLKLEIAAGADQAIDPEGLRRAALQRAVQAEKRKDMVSQRRPASEQDAPISASEYATYLERAYQQARFPKPRNLLGMPKALPVDEMEKLMLTHQAAGEEELRTLATLRAQAVQSWLVEQGQVPLSRIFLLPVKLEEASKTDPDSGRNRVDFSLR